ncbi:MAG: hypothetical protein KDB14_33590 [Planctomycetales bacterium]|nr:hypothetical protein [Planctomycetales bacterium]
MNQLWIRRLLLGGAYLSAIVYFSFQFLPHEADLRSRYVLLNQRECLVKQAGAIPMQLTQLHTEMEETRAFCVSWQSNLTRCGELPDELTRIAEQAEAHGVKVVEFKPQPAATACTELKQARLRLVVATTYPQLLEFLAELERGQPTLWVERMSIREKQASQNEQDNRATLSCELEFAVFADNSADSDDVIHAPRPISRESR